MDFFRLELEMMHRPRRTRSGTRSGKAKEMNDKAKVKTSGLSFLSALTILFIGLKLSKIVTWSWWWVLGPLWLPVAVKGVLLGTVLALGNRPKNAPLKNVSNNNDEWR